jgi:hypothetical protein
MENLRLRNTFVTKLSTVEQVPVNTHGSRCIKNCFVFWECIGVGTTQKPYFDHQHATKIIHCCDVYFSRNLRNHECDVEELAVFPINSPFNSSANAPGSCLLRLQFLYFDRLRSDEEQTMVSAGETFDESRV